MISFTIPLLICSGIRIIIGTMKNAFLAIGLLMIMIHGRNTENVAQGMNRLSCMVVPRSSCLNHSTILATIENAVTEVPMNGTSQNADGGIGLNFAHVVSATVITTAVALFLIAFRLLRGGKCRVTTDPNGLVTVSLA